MKKLLYAFFLTISGLLAVAQVCSLTAILDPDTPSKRPIFQSKEGTATLIGFSEFVDSSAEPPVEASSPPKKYRRKDTAGTLNRGEWSGTSDCENTDNDPVAYEGSFPPIPPGFWGDSTGSVVVTPVSVDEANNRVLYELTSENFTVNTQQTAWAYLGDLRVAVISKDQASGAIFDTVGQQFYLSRDAAKNPHKFVIHGYWGLAGWINNAPTEKEIDVRKVVAGLIRDDYDTSEVYSLPGGTVSTTETGGRHTGVGKFPLSSGGSAVSGGPSLVDFQGLIQSTADGPTQQTIRGTGTCVAAGTNYRKATGEVVTSLSEEDTDNDAFQRALNAAGNGTSDTAFREKRTTGFSFSFSQVEFTAPFNVKCAGKHDILVTLRKRDRSKTEPEPDYIKTIPGRYFESGRQSISGRFDISGMSLTVDGQTLETMTYDTDYTLVNVQLQRSCTDLQPGSSEKKLNSVHVDLGLGHGLAGNNSGSIRLANETITSAIYTPGALTAVTSAYGDVETVKDVAGAIRQVKAPQTLADIVTLDSSSYEVRFYSLDDVGSQDSTTKLYTVSGTPFVVYKVENPDSAQSLTNRLKLTETRGANVRVTEYSFNAGTATWSLSTGGGLRRESLLTAIVAGDTVKTTTIRDENDEVISQITRTYHTYAWGEELVSEVLDPAGDALATNYQFYDNSSTDSANFGRLKLQTNSDGSWEKHTWDSNGRSLKTVRPFLNSLPTDADSSSRVTEISYDTIADMDGDEIEETRTTTVEKTLGTETARHYRVEWSKPVTFGSDACKRRIDAVCVASGAAWNATGNLVTETLVYASGPHSGSVKRVVNADGTMQLTAYTLASNGQETATIKIGAPNTGKTDIVDGTATTTIRSGAGQVISEVVNDIASGLTLSSWTASQFDSLGRTTRIDYTDGTYATKDYACCGLASERDRFGGITSYGFDALGRQDSMTRGGITTKTKYDADGRVKSITRIGTDDSEIVLEQNAYDISGRRIEHRDAMNRATSYDVVFNGGTGESTRTTTNPDSSMRVEKYARDGSLLNIGGEAAAPRQYDYGVDAGEFFTKEILVGEDVSHQSTTTEWVKTYIDFAGRSYKTVYPDNATAQSYFNALGQLERQVDPDGVTTLFAYNSRGEQETTAVDLDANDIIDYAGADRITRTVNTVALHDTTVVQRSTTSVWETDNQDTPTTVSVVDQASDGLHSWQTVRGLTTSSVTTLDGSGGRTLTTTAPDQSKMIQAFTGDQLASAIMKDGSNVQLSATTYAYDEHGRLETATDARNGATSYTYYNDGQIHTITTPDPDTSKSLDGYNPQTTTYAYDSAGRTQTVTQPDGNVISTSYWPTGAVKRTWGARTYPVEYTYDPQGRVKTLTTWQNFAGDSGKAVTTWNYDSQRGWLNNKRYSDNTGPSYTYWPSGRLHTRVWARSPTITTTYTYNPAGDLEGTDYSDTTPDVTIDYNRLGQPKTIIDGSGTRGLTYDYSGQLKDEDCTAGLLNTLGVHRTFDSKARLESVSTISATSTLSETSYGYDDASRLSAVTTGSATATYGYITNAPSLVQSVTFKSGTSTRLTTTKVYDSLNRLVSVTNAPSVGSARTVGYLYNSANQRTRATREDNSYWSYGFDALGQVTSGKKYLSTGTLINGLDYAWTYDDIGNRKTSVINGESATYTPNLRNQYEQRTVPGAVDVFGAANAAATVTLTVNGGSPQTVVRQGELFSRHLVVNNATVAQNPSVAITGVKNLVGSSGEDAVTTVNKAVYLPQTPEVFAHDADGNLVDDARWHYTWDGENRLIAMETSTDAIAVGVSKQRLEFAYDSQSRRFSKAVYSWNGIAWALSSSRMFLYDGWNLLAELMAPTPSTFAVVRSYSWGSDLSGSFQGAGGVGGLLFTLLASPSSSHASSYDGTGNVIAAVDMSSGITVAAFDYNAFGETIATEGVATDDILFRFSTKFSDSETGQLYYGLRYYNPGAGRWLSKDPIEEQGGINLYGMVGNDPTNRIDAIGLEGTWGFNGMMGPIHPPINPGAYVPQQFQQFSARADSLIEQVKRVLPGREGSFSPISWTFLWVPYPGGAWKVEASVEGAIKKCCRSDGGTGLVAEITVEISTSVGLGYGAGGNHGLKRDRNGRLRDSGGRFAKNPEKGFGGVEGGGAATAELAACASTLDGSIVIEVGGRAGAYVSVNPFANVSFAFSDPVSFDYGLRLGVSGYVGAELYLKASGIGSGTLLLK